MRLRRIFIIIIMPILFLTSFIKRSYFEKNYHVTEEINKNIQIYSSYLANSMEIEDTIKIETRADQATLDSIYKVLEEEYNKSAVISDKGMVVGVIKTNTCGSNKTINIRMNVENKNPNTHSWGMNWIAWNYYNTGGYCLVGNRYDKAVSMNFCIVDGGYFERWEHDYALLKLSNTVPPASTGISTFYRYQDNEDDVCDDGDHGIWINGERISGDIYYGNSVTKEGGCKLNFYYFSKDVKNPAVRPFDFLDFRYAVFGRFGYQQGFIYIDDEDDKNNNSFYPDFGYNPYTNIFEGESNTTYYFSLVGQYCGHEYLNE